MNSINNNANNLETINVLRFPLIVLVLFVHLIGFEIQPIILSWKNDAIYNFITILISHNLGRIAVPCFFMFSGYFFFYKLLDFTIGDYFLQLRNRFKTLLIPFVFWNILMAVSIFIKNYIFIKLNIQNIDNETLPNQYSFYTMFWEGPVNFPLWYIRDLICMTILTPIFYLLFKYLKWIGLLLLISCYILTLETNIPGFSSTAIVFFGAGSFFGLYKFDIIEQSRKSGFYITIIALVLLVLSTYWSGIEYYEYLIRIFILFGVWSTLYFGYIMMLNNNLKNFFISLSPSVFFIYAIHEIYVINWIKGFFAHMTWSSSGYGALLAYFIIPILTATVCILLYKIFRKYFPTILVFATGGRN